MKMDNVYLQLRVEKKRFNFGDTFTVGNTFKAIMAFTISRQGELHCHCYCYDEVTQVYTDEVLELCQLLDLQQKCAAPRPTAAFRFFEGDTKKSAFNNKVFTYIMLCYNAMMPW